MHTMKMKESSKLHYDNEIEKGREIYIYRVILFYFLQKNCHGCIINVLFKPIHVQSPVSRDPLMLILVRGKIYYSYLNYIRFLQLLIKYYVLHTKRCMTTIMKKRERKIN